MRGYVNCFDPFRLANKKTGNFVCLRGGLNQKPLKSYLHICWFCIQGSSQMYIENIKYNKECMYVPIMLQTRRYNIYLYVI